MRLNSHITLVLAGALLSVSMSHAAIMWAEEYRGDAYTSGMVRNFQADTSINATAPTFEGITVAATANQDGGEFFSNGTANGQIRFLTTTPMATNDSITFNFGFNMQLFSGARINGVAGRTRSAALFRVDPAGPDTDTSVQGEATITMGGGADTLSNYFGATPADDAQEFLNSGILAVNLSTDASVGAVHHRASFQSLSGNTAIFHEATGTDADSSQFGLALTDHANGSQDFSFQSWEFTYTHTGTADLAAGAAFIFTFAGQNPEAQLALQVPEPTVGVLALLGSLSLLTRRRR